MDFIDYEAFAVVSPSPAEAANDSLPEPSSMLNLSSFVSSSTHTNDSFKIPNSLKDQKLDTNAEKVNLYERMAEHVGLFMGKLDLNEIKSPNQALHVREISQFTEPTKATSRGTEFHDMTLNKRQPTSEVTNLILTRKLSKVLNEYVLTNYQTRMNIRKSLQSLEENREKLSLDDGKLIDAGYVGNLARKSLRSDLENELLKEHLTVLEEFRPIIRRMKRLSSSIENIKNVGQTILADSEGSESNIQEQDLSKRIEAFRSDLQHLKLKKEILTSMRNKFTLTQVEDNLLTNDPVDLQFFEIVEKAMKIKQRATLLLTLPNSRAGCALIEKINQTLEFVNRKTFNHLVDFLYNFESGSSISTERTFSPNDYDLIVFHKCLIYISNDLEYFNEFLKKVTTMRSKNVLDRFLSQFDYNPKDSRPILLSAGDPLRYIGDVLANVHTSIANEADFVKSLFKFQDEQMENDMFSIPQQNKEFLRGLDEKLLNEIVQTLSNTCRIRIEQIVKFEEDPVMNLEIFRLLSLYQLMFIRKGISDENPMVGELKSLEEVSRKQILGYFTKSLSNLPDIDGNDKDLMPPEWLSEYIAKVVELFEVYERGSSLESDETLSVIDYSFLKSVILSPVEDVLLKRLQQSFPLARKNDEARCSLLTKEINCLDLIKSRLQPFSNSLFSPRSPSSSILKEIEEKLNDLNNRMLELQVKLLLENTGLSLYYNLFNMIFPITSVQDELDYDMYLSLCENPLMKLETINQRVNQKLNDYIPRALTDVQGNLLFRLISPGIADQICDASLAKLCLFYVTFRRVLMHLYPDRKGDIAQILNFSEEDFQTLVGIH